MSSKPTGFRLRLSLPKGRVPTLASAWDYNRWHIALHLVAGGLAIYHRGFEKVKLEQPRIVA